MDKELEKALRDLKGAITDLLNGDADNMAKRVSDRIEEAMHEKAEISIVSLGDGKAETRVEGSNMAILVALAGLEKTILTNLDVPTKVWEMIKDVIGAEVVR